jgi:pimeloyl-ACP methyl ester carboxylesterase
MLHYLACGAGADMVLVHGFLGNQAVWHLQIAPQLRRYYRVTSYDLRGHGYSDVPPSGYTAGDMAADLLGLLDALGIQKPTLIGHSFGADVCMYFAHEYPDRVERLVALEPGLAALVNQRKDETWEGWAYWVRKLEEVGIQVPEDRRTDLNYLLEVSLNTPKFYGPARGLPRNRDPLINLIRNTSLISDYEHVGELTLEAVSRITVPTLLVYGEKSHFIGAYRTLKDVLPNVIPVLLPGGEHFGPLEQPELLTRHILDFAGKPMRDMVALGTARAGAAASG